MATLDFNLGPNQNHFDLPEMDKCQTDDDCRAQTWWFKPENLRCANYKGECTESAVPRSYEGMNASSLICVDSLKISKMVVKSAE